MKLDDALWTTLERKAEAVRNLAYAPYSRYLVGAALVADDGEIFVGCNVENASYGLTICAERNAISQMIAAGRSHPQALVVVTSGSTPGSPCGMCRQTLAEFAEDMPIRLLSIDLPSAKRETSLSQLLPDAFGGKLLAK